MSLKTIKKMLLTINNIFLKSLNNYLEFGIFSLELPVYIILRDIKLVYHVISKSACTTIKFELGEKYGINNTIHTSEIWGDKRIEGNLQELEDGYFNFSFVRNPFSRIVSCYKDKILVEDYKNSHFYKNYPIVENNTDFSTFINRIYLIPDCFANRHFKSQYSSLKYNNISWTFIGKIESLNEDWKAIANQYGFNENIRRANSTSQKLNPLEEDNFPEYYKYYDLDSCKKVYKRYRKDIHEFGYYEEYINLKKFLEKN